MQVFMNVCVCVCARVYECMCVYTCACACVRAHVYECVSVCMRIWEYTQAHEVG